MGSCLRDNPQIDECCAWITEADFYRSVYGEVWTAIVAIRDSGKEVNAVTMADHLERLGRFDDIGGDGFLGEICGCVNHGLDAVMYARMIREYSTIRQLIDAASETMEEVYSNRHEAKDLIERFESRVFAITDRAAVGETIDAETLVGQTWERLQSLRERRTVGLPTGFRDLDDMIAGLGPGQLIILAARPAMGKTALALNIASQVAMDGKGVLFVSLEMGRTELGNRLFSSFGNVNGASLLKPWFLQDAQWQSILDACNRISRFPLFIDDTPQRTVSQIAANARRIKHRSPCGIGLIVVDYLGLINGQKLKGESRQEEVARVSRRLKAAARDLRVPVVALHQLNRNIEHRDDHRPRMADLRESGQIEQDADMVLLLHRPEYYKPEDRPGIAELIVAKNRNGQEGTVRLAWNGALTRFDSLAPQDAAPAGPPRDDGLF